MSKTMHSIAATAVLLLMGFAAFAQGDWYREREERYRDEHWRARLFTQVRQDLDHMQAVAFSGRDEYRIARTKEDLNDLQADLTAGRYNEEKLDEVIGGLQRMVADSHLEDRDKGILNDDMQRLRDYRAHHEGWGQ